MEALGTIETVGLAAAFEAADVACKTANVELIGYELAKGGGFVTIKVVGKVGAVNSAIAAAKAAAEKVNRVVATLVIPRPASQIEPLIRNAATRGYRPEPAAVETVAEPATDVEQTTEVPAGDQSAPARRTTRKKAAPKTAETEPLPESGAEPPTEQASDNH